jgi:hypothetical protein
MRAGQSIRHLDPFAKLTRVLMRSHNKVFDPLQEISCDPPVRSQGDETSFCKTCGLAMPISEVWSYQMTIYSRMPSRGRSCRCMRSPRYARRRPSRHDHGNIVRSVREAFPRRTIPLRIGGSPRKWTNRECMV